MFDSGTGQLLSRAWLLDPVETQVAASVAPRSTGGEREDWNGEYYVSFGQSGSRSWNEARRYGFVSDGNGTWYSGTLRLLKPGDRIWVKAPQYGFVGVGRVRGGPVRAAEFTLPGPDGRDVPAMSVLVEGSYHREFIDDPDRSEYFVPGRLARHGATRERRGRGWPLRQPEHRLRAQDPEVAPHRGAAEAGVPRLGPIARGGRVRSTSLREGCRPECFLKPV